MENFNSLLAELNLTHKNHKEILTKRYAGYYNNFPAHPKLFITSVNKIKPPPMCELCTSIIEEALEKGEMKKLETYVLWTWLLSDNVLGLDDMPGKYEGFQGDEFNIRLIQSCYDEVISPVFEKYYPTKEIQTSNIKIKLDMKLKEAKFDVVYDNVYGGLDYEHLTNKYKHKRDLKKKFLYCEVQPDGAGKIDYQLALFTRLFEVEMILMTK
eukprot:SAG22_NODE_1591_length_4047_cov_653.834093_3_plen_212_part_00